MEIKGFTSVRVGSGWPAAVDVYAIDGHESHGVMAQAWTYRGPKETGYVQVRKAKEVPAVAIIAFRYADTPLPDGWEDSELLWDSGSPNAEDSLVLPCPFCGSQPEERGGGYCCTNEYCPAWGGANQLCPTEFQKRRQWNKRAND